MSGNEILQAINSTYRRWHNFEATLGNDGLTVLDFDFCPDEIDSREPEFKSRASVLEELQSNLEKLSSSAPEQFANHRFLVAKLKGAVTYVRTVLGEKIEFVPYLQDTMGITPVRVPDGELEVLRERAKQGVLQNGFRWHSDDRDAWERKYIADNPALFGRELQARAKQLVSAVSSRVGLSEDPDYDIEISCVDEYWKNWISKPARGKIKLQINTHPRITLFNTETLIYASHEIAGHAVHASTLAAEQRNGNVDSSALNLCVHSCEQFLLEGLAQALLSLAFDPDEVPTDVRDREAMYYYNIAMKNNSQHDLEEGMPVDEVSKKYQALTPFLTPLNIESDLRDRARDPLFRAYTYVYYPSAREFLRVRSLNRSARCKFLKQMYSRMWTPDEIRGIVNSTVS